MKRLWIVAAIGGIVLLALALARPRGRLVKVDAGPVGERVVARGEVVPSAGVVHVYAPSNGQVLRVSRRAGERVQQGEALLELDVAGQPEPLRAPIGGVVLERRVDVGDFVLAGSIAANAWLFELADATHTELHVEVEEADAARVRPGMNVQLGDHAEARGRVVRVSARLTPRGIGASDARVRADGMVRSVTVAWDGAHPDWPIGARVTASIEVRLRAAAARVPRAALHVEDGKTWALRRRWLWTRAVPVDVVSADEVFAEIRGLSAGTEIFVPEAASGDVDATEAVR
jgi:multidrug efflux pump subunit AcrA (membrane-fusion protein)